MKMTGAQILVETLIEQGVDTVFGFPGGMVVDIYDKLYDRQDKIRHILTAHEEGAVHGALGNGVHIRHFMVLTDMPGLQVRPVL